MLHRALTIAIAIGVSVTGGAIEARADPLQDRILGIARATRPEAYSFSRTTVIERTSGPRSTIVERFDPRRSTADRWALISIDGRAPTAKEKEQAQRADRGPVPSYAELAKWFGAAATRSESAAGYVTYRFGRLPDGAVMIGSYDVSADIRAEAIVNTKGKTPFVERVRLTLTKMRRMKLVATVQSMVVTTRFGVLPNGQAVPVESASSTTGSLLGKSGEVRTSTTFTDFRLVR